MKCELKADVVIQITRQGEKLELGRRKLMKTGVNSKITEVTQVSPRLAKQAKTEEDFQYWGLTPDEAEERRCERRAFSTSAFDAKEAVGKSM